MQPNSSQQANQFDVIIVGAGVSGLTAAKKCTELGLKAAVIEQDSSPGGLIRCERINGCLYHLVGGHVFNTKNEDVRDFFWREVCRKDDFVKADRCARIQLEDRVIDYPIENHIGQLDENITDQIIEELLDDPTGSQQEIMSFGDFLQSRFGKTLCEIYFTPYNRKIWQVDPSDMAVEWLDGKLPMPTLKEIFKANILNRTPKSGKAAMVHDSFFYPRHNGSQHIVERLAEGIDIFTGTQVKRIEKNENGDLLVNKTYSARCIIYTGDIRFLPDALDGGTMSDSLISRLRALKSHGTTNILYQCVPSKISWTYIPSPRHKAHRIINTGLFAESNTSGEIRERGSSTSVLEFSGFVSREEVLNEARDIPGFQRMLGYNYKESTYIIQEHGTRQVVSEAKRSLEKFKIFLVGRFAEWEYYNMDTAIEASLQCAYYAAYALDNKHVSG